MGVLTSAEGQVPVRARTRSAPSAGRRESASPPAKEIATGGRVVSASALCAVGAATLMALGVAAAGIDAIKPAAARGAPLPLDLVAGTAANAGTGAFVFTALVHAARIRDAKDLTPAYDPVRDGPLPVTRAGAKAPHPVFTLRLGAPVRQTALAVPPERADGGWYPVTVVARPTPPPAPVPKPRVAARLGTADAVPAVLPKPRTAGHSMTAMNARFNSTGYDLAAIRAAAKSVPRVYLDALPRDLVDVSSIEEKKRLFVQAVLPVVLRVNEELAAARWRAERLSDRLLWADALTPVDRAWLIAAAERYGTEPFDIPSLLKRLDVVPPSLALAQAAEESGWGTSRFAQEGNALFGQYTYKSVTGMVPERRDADQRHQVRRYDNLLEATRAYAHNLNTHHAYEKFRSLRSRLRQAGRPIAGYDLAGMLGHYSARGTAYIETIRQIIRQNRLGDFDRAWLNNRQWTAVAGLPGLRPI